MYESVLYKPERNYAMRMYKYQIIFLGDVTNAAHGEIRSRLAIKINELGISLDAFVMVDASNFLQTYDNKQPAFVYYFGKEGHENRDESILVTLVENGDAILPVFFQANNFNNEVPTVIGKMNGKLYASDDVDKFVNYAFESLRLLRQTRKLFISYRRVDSAKIANQLFDVLNRRNYDTFLDDYSIAVAQDFQDELNHRLSDCDVLIQLYTENFCASEWCVEEITNANQKRIGVLAIIWPGQKLDVHNELCEKIQLLDDNFEDGLLRDEVIREITLRVESLRARNMAARQDDLVGEFIKEASKVGRQLVQEYKYLVEYDEGELKNVFIPAVGVPHSYDCYNSLEFKEILECPDIKLHLIYDDLRIKRSWIDHLDWLNNSIEVKTIKKNDFALWLQNS